MLKPEINSLAVLELLDQVEILVRASGLTYLDAIVHLHEKQNVDIVAVAEIIKKNPKIKAKLKAEGARLHLLRR